MQKQKKSQMNDETTFKKKIVNNCENSTTFQNTNHITFRLNG